MHEVMTKYLFASEHLDLPIYVFFCIWLVFWWSCAECRRQHYRDPVLCDGDGRGENLQKPRTPWAQVLLRRAKIFLKNLPVISLLNTTCTLFFTLLYPVNFGFVPGEAFFFFLQSMSEYNLTKHFAHFLLQDYMRTPFLISDTRSLFRFPYISGNFSSNF